MKKIRQKILGISLVVCLLAATGITGMAPKTVKAAVKFKIHYIDVGAGDGALLQYGEGDSAEYALIDAGPETYKTSDGKTVDVSERVHDYLQKHNVTHLKFVLLTHPHHDHIGGMIKVLKDEKIEIDTIYGNPKELKYLASSDNKDEQSAETAEEAEFDSKVYQNVLEAIQVREDAGETKYETPKAGSSIMLGEAKVTFYGPLENKYQYGRKVDLNTRQENKYSIVCKIVYGNNTFLMTGDAQKETVEKIMEKGYDLTAQVLKVPHHGYQDVTETGKKRPNYTSDHKLMFDQSKASIAIISNGYKNEAGTPYDRVLKDLSAMNVYQTSDKGTIVVTSDGNMLSIAAEKGGTTPSHAGSGTTSSPLMSQMKITSNNTKKLVPTLTSAANTYKIYEKKNITVKFSGTAKPFTKLTSIQYKFVKKGVNNTKVSWKTGKSMTVKNGSCGRIYVKYNTPLGSTTIKLPGFTVDTKAPSSVKIKANKSGIKMLKTSAKNTYKKRYKKSIKFTFSASYGTSGKSKTQYKIVPKGKKHTKYKWKTANSVTYKKKNKKVRLYVRYIDKSGNVTTRKTNGFYVKK